MRAGEADECLRSGGDGYGCRAEIRGRWWPARAAASADGLMAKGGKTKLDGFGAASAYALKTDLPGTVFEKGRTTINIPASGWAADARGWQEKTVDCAGTVVSSAVQRVDVAVQGAQIGSVLLAARGWTRTTS